MPKSSLIPSPNLKEEYMRYVIFLFNNLTVIGKVEESFELNEKRIKNPRAIQIVPKDGQQYLSLGELVGQPKDVLVPKGSLWFYVEDKNVIDAYLKATTTLAIVSSFPPNLRN